MEKEIRVDEREGNKINGKIYTPATKGLHSWHTSNKDMNTNFSGYHLWGKTRQSMLSWTTLPCKSSIRNPQCPPDIPKKNLIIETIVIKISTQNFQSIFLGFKQGAAWQQGWPTCDPNLQSGSLNAIKVPLQRTHHAWTTSNYDIKIKLSWYLHWV